MNDVTREVDELISRMLIADSGEHRTQLVWAFLKDDTETEKTEWAVLIASRVAGVARLSMGAQTEDSYELQAVIDSFQDATTVGDIERREELH